MSTGSATIAGALSRPRAVSGSGYDALVAISREPDLVVPDAPLVPVEDLPDATLVFTLASRYIQSDLIGRAWELFGSTPRRDGALAGSVALGWVRRSLLAARGANAGARVLALESAFPSVRTLQPGRRLGRAASDLE